MARNALLIAAGVLAVIITATPARAAYIVNYVQSGNNVIGTGSGTISLLGLTQLPRVPMGFVSIAGSNVVLGIELGPGEAYSGLVGPKFFGTRLGVDSGKYLDSLTGPRVGLSSWAGLLVVPNGFMGGALPESTAGWNNVTISSLGLTPGTYTWTWGGQTPDSFVVNVGSANTGVPEPSGMGLTLCGMGFLSLVMWKRRRAAGRLRQAN